MRELGLAGTIIGRLLGLAESAVSRAVARGAAIVTAEQFDIPLSTEKRLNS